LQARKTKKSVMGWGRGDLRGDLQYTKKGHDRAVIKGQVE